MGGELPANIDVLARLKSAAQRRYPSEKETVRHYAHPFLPSDCRVLIAKEESVGRNVDGPRLS